MSQQDKTLDNTEISKTDIKELEKGEDKKLDNTSSTSSTKKSSKKSSKSKKDNSYTDSSDKALGVEAQKPIDAGSNPIATSLQNIQTALTDPALKKDFLNNVADLLAQYQRRKLTDTEIKTLENTVEDGLLTKVFKLKKTV